MNSRQINLYLADSDRAQFESALRKAGEFRVINSITDGDALNLLDSTDVSRMGEERLKIYLASPADLDLIQLNRLPTKSYKTIDVLRSPVIEFSRCYQDDEKIRRGRLYFVTAFYNQEGVLIQKDKYFIDWAKNMFKSAKKFLSKGPDPSVYYGKDALVLMRRGIKFTEI